MSVTITNVTTQTEAASTTSLAITGVTAAIGDWLILGVSLDNNGTAGVASLSATVTDSAGNTWVNQSLTNQTAGVAGDGATLGVYTCHVTAALSAGSVTINCSPATVAKAVAMQKMVAGTGETVAVHSVGAGVAGSSTAQSAGAVSVPIGATIFGFTAMEINGAPTADS